MRANFVVAASILGAVTSSACADWYNGDPYAAAANIPQAAFYYPANLNQLHLGFTNFTWTPGASGGQVGTVGGLFHSFGQSPAANIDSAYWEIRSGMSDGVAGTLIASGSGAPTATSTSFTQGGAAVARVSLGVPLFTLPAGNYFFAMAIGDTPNGGWFTASTTGAAGINGAPGGGSSIYYETYNAVVGWNYVALTPANDPLYTDTGNSYFINEAPAPGTMLLIGAGGTLPALRRRRTT